jgi:hypothetical protein
MSFNPRPEARGSLQIEGQPAARCDLAMDAAGVLHVVVGWFPVLDTD